MAARSRAMADAPKRRLWFYSVQGRGSFPIDMLRYDRCWPASEGGDSAKVEASFQPRASREERIVALIGLDEPTEGRWASFGWKVL